MKTTTKITMLTKKMLVVSILGAVAGCMTVDEMLASDNPVFRAIGESQTVNLAVDASRQHTAEERAAAVNKLKNQDKLAEIVISHESTPEVRKLAQGKITEQKAAARIVAEVESDEIAAENIALIKEDNMRLEAGYAAFLKNRYQRAEKIIRGVENTGAISDKIREAMNKDEKLEAKIAAGDFKTQRDLAAAENARASNYRFGMILVNALQSSALISSLLEDQRVANKYSACNSSGFNYYDPLVCQYVKTLTDQNACREIVLGKTKFKKYSGNDLRLIALNRITDDQVLGDVFAATKELDVLERIKSTEVLNRIFLNEKDIEISEQILSKVDNQEFIVDLANNASALKVRSIAIGLIKDPAAKSSAQKSLDDALAAKKAAQEKAAAERKALLDAFERELPAKIDECDKQFHFRVYTKCPAKEKRLKTYVVLMYRKQGLTDAQIKEGLKELDEKLMEMPPDADENQQDMGLTALCNSMHPLGGSDLLQEMEEMQRKMQQ